MSGRDSRVIELVTSRRMCSDDGGSESGLCFPLSGDIVAAAFIIIISTIPTSTISPASKPSTFGKMRSTALLLACAAIANAVSPESGFLWTIDQSVSSSSSSSIDADSASSILARRRGLTSARYLSTTDELKLQEIEHYGGWQQPLFGEGKADGPGKLFIRISGYDSGIKGLGDAMPDLWIEEPTKDLKTDFKAQKRIEDGICEYTVPPSKNNPSVKGIEVIFSYPVEGVCNTLTQTVVRD
jgi:hypothetical protein